jgi:hypothetical protein
MLTFAWSRARSKTTTQKHTKTNHGVSKHHKLKNEREAEECEGKLNGEEEKRRREKNVLEGAIFTFSS